MTRFVSYAPVSRKVDAKQSLITALDFIHNKIMDHNGNYFGDYLDMNENDMEESHDWIQWAFPIDTVSPHNPYAGLIPHVLSSANGYGKLYPKATYITDIMLAKYLQSIGVCNTVNMKKFFRVVDSGNNHHVKRISRVIRHLRLIMDSKGADAILDRLAQIVMSRPGFFSNRTILHWHSIPIYHSDICLLTDTEQLAYT